MRYDLDLGSQRLGGEGDDVGISLHAGWATATGKRRTANEDAVRVYWDAPEIRAAGRGGIFAVADGLGGHRGGGEASRITVDRLADFFRVPDAHFDEERTLLALIQSINLSVWRLGSEDPERRRMGCTLSLIYADPPRERLLVVHVGDSRVYRMEPGGALEQMSRDHVDPEFTQVLSRRIGKRGAADLDVAEHALRPGDRWMICSDGVCRDVSDEEIGRVLSGGADPQDAADGLVALAGRGGRDNATALVVYVLEGNDPVAPDVSPS